jgi:hypothetical protein
MNLDHMIILSGVVISLADVLLSSYICWKLIRFVKNPMQLR